MFKINTLNIAMLHKILCIIIFLIMMQNDLISQNIKFTAKTDTSDYQIAQLFNLYVDGKFNVKIDSLYPNIKDSLGLFEVFAVDKKDNDKWIFYLSTTDSGKIFIPPIEFICYTNNGTVVKKYTNSVLVNIVNAKLDPNSDIVDIKPQMNAPWTIEDLLPFAIVLFVIMLLVLSYIYYKHYLKKKEKAKLEEKILIPPHKQALHDLYALEEKRLWQQGNIKQYYSEVTEIIRTFFEGRWNIIALEMTTEEILEQMKNIPEALVLWKEMETFFVKADLVKFAKHFPTPEENEQELQVAYKIVRSMIPKTETDISSNKESELKENVR